MQYYLYQSKTRERKGRLNKFGLGVISNLDFLLQRRVSHHSKEVNNRRFFSPSIHVD